MVAFDEELGSPKITFQNGFGAVRTGWISWDDRFNIIETIFPGTFTAGATQVPGVYASFPDFEQLRADSIEIEPHVTKEIGPNVNQELDTLITYERAKVTIRYSTRGGELPVDEADAEDEGDPVPLLSHKWSAGGEFLTIDNEGLYWTDDSVANNWDRVTENVPIGLFIPQTEHQVTWERVLDPPFTAIRAIIGKVNETRGQFATGVIYKETLLFIGAELERTIFSDGARAWKLAYRFSERCVDAKGNLEADSISEVVPGVTDPLIRALGGWNHFWRKGTENDQAGFYRIVLARDLEAESPYKKANFGPLFARDSIEPD